MTRQANLAVAYRKARQDFIAASGGDTVSRVHPAQGPDGKPLFCDSVAFGPRDAGRALLLIGGPLATLLRRGIRLPPGARLVVVHTPDPYVRAWGKPGAPADWPQKTLGSIAGEDLSRVRDLIVLDMEAIGCEAALAAALPRAALDFRDLAPQQADQAVLAAIAAL